MARIPNRRPTDLPPPTPSEAAFERALANLREGASVSAPPPIDESARRDLDALFARRDEFLDRDPYASIGRSDGFNTKLAGVSHENRQDLVAALRVGEELTLLREPENPYDANAIAAMYGRLRVGFINKGIAKRIAPNIDAGERYQARITAITGGGEGRSYGVNVYVWRERSAPLAPVTSENRAASESIEADVRTALIGERSMRDAQRDVLTRLAAGARTLAILGTGRGKSFCFQYPAAIGALAEQKKTLVVYPLRALANDQYEAMQRRLGPLGVRIFRANGAIDGEERLRLMDALESGGWDIVCSTPEFVQYHVERFTTPASTPALVVVDECHHLAESTHRPAYLALGTTIAQLGAPSVLALTATAADDVFPKIVEALGITAWVIDPAVRENLSVVDARNHPDKHGYIAEIVRDDEKAIVYCNSRSEATKVAERLRPALHGAVAFYHAGMGTADRSLVEKLFRSGDVRVVVATSAFGEGIDLPDVRHVVLYHLNFDFTEFNQQAGRAGRDGLAASIHLLFGERDRSLNDYIIAKSAPSLHVLREIYRGLKGLSFEGVLRMNYADAERTLALDRVDAGTIGVAVRIFEDAGLVETGNDDDGRFVRFREVAQKVDLTTNARFAEGQAERADFERFADLVLTASPQTLESIINRPMYPSNVPLLR